MRILVIIYLLLICQHLCAQETAKAYDLGVFYSDADTTFNLPIKNSTTDAMLLTEVRTECGCVVVLNYPDRVEAASEANMRCMVRPSTRLAGHNSTVIDMTYKCAGKAYLRRQPVIWEQRTPIRTNKISLELNTDSTSVPRVQGLSEIYNPYQVDLTATTCTLMYNDQPIRNVSCSFDGSLTATTIPLTISVPAAELELQDSGFTLQFSSRLFGLDGYKVPVDIRNWPPLRVTPRRLRVLTSSGLVNCKLTLRFATAGGFVEAVQTDSHVSVQQELKTNDTLRYRVTVDSSVEHCAPIIIKYSDSYKGEIVIPIDLIH